MLRTDRHYENFVLQIDWMHIEPGGNSGLYVWTTGAESRGPKGIEIQILDLDWVRLNTAQGEPPPPIAYVHGEFIARQRQEVRARQSARRAQHVAREPRKGRGEWNTYTVVAVDGVIKLGVNGKFVNGIAQSAQKKGYLGLQSEGAEIHFRNIRIMELPPGVTVAGTDRARFALKRPHAGDDDISPETRDITSRFGGTAQIAYQLVSRRLASLELEPDIRLHGARGLPRVGGAKPCVLRPDRAWFSASVGVELVVDDGRRIARAGERQRVDASRSTSDWFGALNASTRSWRLRPPPSRMSR